VELKLRQNFPTEKMKEELPSGRLGGTIWRPAFGFSPVEQIHVQSRRARILWRSYPALLVLQLLALTE
jgi:hypothetical protein